MTASTTTQLLSVKWSNTQHCISVSLLNLDCKRTFNTNRSQDFCILTYYNPDFISFILTLLLRIKRGLEVDVLLKIIKFDVTTMEVSVCFGWSLEPLVLTLLFLW